MCIMMKTWCHMMCVMTQVAAPKPKVWEKQKKKKGKAKKKPVKVLATTKKATTLTPGGTPMASGDKDESKDSNPSTPNGVSMTVSRLSRDPRFPSFFPILVFLKISWFLFVFLRHTFCHTSKLYMRISELCKFCSEYQNVANFATIFIQNLTRCKVKECHKLLRICPTCSDSCVEQPELS